MRVEKAASGKCQHGAAVLGRTPSEVARDAGLMAEAAVASYRTYGHDLVTVGIDIYNIEAEALGAAIRIPGEYECPDIDGRLYALDALEDSGYRYSSSIYPIRHDRYGMPDAPRFAFHPNDDDFVEFPVTTVRIGNKNLPCGGGGWFRLVPYGGMRWAMRRVNAVDRAAVIFYFHTWEIDPAQPRQQKLDPKTRFRHYLNLARMEKRLRRLLGDTVLETIKNADRPLFLSQ